MAPTWPGCQVQARGIRAADTPDLARPVSGDISRRIYQEWVFVMLVAIVLCPSAHRDLAAVREACWGSGRPLSNLALLSAAIGDGTAETRTCNGAEDGHAGTMKVHEYECCADRYPPQARAVSLPDLPAALEGLLEDVDRASLARALPPYRAGFVAREMTIRWLDRWLARGRHKVPGWTFRCNTSWTTIEIADRSEKPVAFLLDPNESDGGYAIARQWTYPGVSEWRRESRTDADVQAAMRLMEPQQQDHGEGR